MKKVEEDGSREAACFIDNEEFIEKSNSGLKQLTEIAELSRKNKVDVDFEKILKGAKDYLV